jgi:hypothetical protein
MTVMGMMDDDILSFSREEKFVVPTREILPNGCLVQFAVFTEREV